MVFNTRQIPGRASLTMTGAIIGIFAVFVIGSEANAQDGLQKRFEETSLLLEKIRKDISLSSRTEANLAVEITGLERDSNRLNDELLKSATRSRELARKIERSSARVVELEAERKDLYAALNHKRSLLGEVLGALQRMGNNPPPALLVTPQDALMSVRSAILLGSVVPGMRSETRILAEQLSELVRLTHDIDKQRDILTENLRSEALEEKRISLLVQEKRKRFNLAKKKLASESLKAAKLAAKATSLSNLIKELQSEIESVKQAATAAKAAEDELRNKQNARIASAREEVLKPDFSDTSRISPAVSFLKAKGHLIRPVNGVEIRKFGERDELGDPSASIAVATRINARVISPADGWVVYSGKFRSYGQMLILDVGSNHYIVMSGMEKIDAVLGQFVLVGEPVGIMGASRIASAGTFDIGSSRPVLEIEFRNGNEPIDPAQWWQNNTDKRSKNDT